MLCTEVNQTCAGGKGLPHAVAQSLPQESLRGAGGRPEVCRCAGTISIYINDDGLTVKPGPIDHGRVIDALDHPMCRLKRVITNPISMQRA